MKRLQKIGIVLGYVLLFAAIVVAVLYAHIGARDHRESQRISGFVIHIDGNGNHMLIDTESMYKWFAKHGVSPKGKSIADILDMTIEEACDFFSNQPRILSKIQTLFDVGLGYVRLGQSSTTLSGGEAQRIKLATELSKKLKVAESYREKAEKFDRLAEVLSSMMMGEREDVVSDPIDPEVELSEVFQSNAPEKQIENVNALKERLQAVLDELNGLQFAL